MSFVERYDPREGKWAHAGTIDNFDIGCTCALVSNSIYWKDWNASLQYFDPRCQLSELVQELYGWLFSTFLYHIYPLYFTVRDLVPSLLLRIAYTLLMKKEFLS